MRLKLLTHTILDAIQMANGYALPEQTLRGHVNGLLRPPATDDEWAGRIKWLSDEGKIVRIPDSIDPDLVQWSITERGRVLLATL